MVSNGGKKKYESFASAWGTALEEDWNTPWNTTIESGGGQEEGDPFLEYHGQYSNINMFSTALSTEKMVNMTQPGNEECGAPGDIFSWTEDVWNLRSNAKMMSIEQHAGPCRRESSIQLFAGNFEHHSDCMEHCQKIGMGRVPPVRTLEEVQHLQTELEAITPDVTDLPDVWLSTTDSQEEDVWRDYYTEEELGNFTKPWVSLHYFSVSYNCMAKMNQMPANKSWIPSQCKHFDKGCPCQYSKTPIVRLRGLCIHSHLRFGIQWTFKQTAGAPREMMIVEQYASQINYNWTSSMWEMTTTAAPGVKATTPASHISYALGKHEWLVTGDSYKCHKGEPTKYYMKLTSCHGKKQFTCDDGHCVTIEQRCDQLPDCRDGSDESGCQLLVLGEGYKKDVAPISSVCEPDCTLVPVKVHISISLLKIVSMEEVQHKIDLQFGIILEWNELRAEYLNLKSKASLNALTQDEIGLLWLPYVVYANTDMKEAVQLTNDVKTTIVIRKEGIRRNTKWFDVDETEIYDGIDNKMAMHQTYTKSFQCQYHLQKYPFDTQVSYN